MKQNSVFQKLFVFYRDGFSSMTVGKTLWLIIIIKLFIMFIVLKIFFFPNFLNSNFDTEEEKATHVGQELIDKKVN